MAKNPRPTHDQLQRDEIADSFHETLELIHNNRRTILMAVIALILLAIAVRAFNIHSADVKSQLNNQVALLLSQYERIQTVPDAKERTAATQKLIADVDKAAKDYDGGSVLARSLILLKGKAYYSLDQFSEARTSYEQFVKTAGDNEERARGEIALAYTYENQAFLPTSGTLIARSLVDQAIEHFKAAQQFAENQSPYLYYYAMLGEARCNEVVGNNDKAIQLYDKVLKDRPAPKPEATPAEKESKDMQTNIANMLRSRIKDAEAQLNLAATAQQRLDRLRAKATTLAPASAVSVTTTTATR